MVKKAGGSKKPRSEKQIAATKKAQEARKAKLEAEKHAAERSAAVQQQIQDENTEVLSREDSELRERAAQPVVPQPEIATDGAPQPRPPMTPSPFSQASESDKDKIIIALQQELLDAYRNNSLQNVSKEQVLDEMASMRAPQSFNGDGVHISAGGGIQGRMVKHSLKKGDYPDPTSRLYDDERLKRHNLRENYIFTWDVTGEQYEKNGVTYAEPRFTVCLYRRLFDDMDMPTGKAALISRTMLHEDEFVAQIIADRLGMLDNFASTKEMMDEVRYRRIRDWLIPIFIPSKPEEHANRRTEMVIDGKAVEVFDTEKVLGEAAADSKASAIQQQVRR